MNIVKNSTISYVDVYVTRITSTLDFNPIFPIERENEINSITNERLKREKYTAWKLLEYAIEKSLDTKIENAELYKDENGKWRSPYFELSISHSESVAAVVISHAPVGIDLEPLYKTLSESFAKKNLTENEYSEYEAQRESQKNEFLLTRWCVKEAVFKRNGGKVFFPSKIDPDKKEIFTTRFVMDANEFVCAVAGVVSEVLPRFSIIEKV